MPAHPGGSETSRPPDGHEDDMDEDCCRRSQRPLGCAERPAAFDRFEAILGGDPVTGAQRDPGPPSYELRVRGHLGETMQLAFPVLAAETRDGDTVLRGALPDQAALHGVLAKIEALGLELLEVRRLPPS